jgi:selenocysteine lyase/cysteine desulfurase
MNNFPLKPAQSTYAYCEGEDLPRKSYNAIRFSTHVFDDEAEIDRAVDVLRKVKAVA